MLNIDSNRPSELVRSLDVITFPVKHLRVNCSTQFWDSGDNIQDLGMRLQKMKNLEFIEIIGNSYPKLADVSSLVEFITKDNHCLKFLKMNIRPPFPGEYRIQDIHFMMNTILQKLFTCRELRGSIFIPDEDNEWVQRLNTKISSLFRSRQPPNSQL